MYRTQVRQSQVSYRSCSAPKGLKLLPTVLQMFQFLTNIPQYQHFSGTDP